MLYIAIGGYLLNYYVCDKCYWIIDLNMILCQLFCDNTSVINISKNPIQHSRTKHIDLKHHFIWELVEEKEIELEFVSTDKQLAYIFNKPLSLG